MGGRSSERRGVLVRRLAEGGLILESPRSDCVRRSDAGHDRGGVVAIQRVGLGVVPSRFPLVMAAVVTRKRLVVMQQHVVG